MGKIIVTQEFDPYEDKQELNRFMRRDDAFSILCDVDQELRKKLKHGEDKWLEVDGIQTYLEKLRYMIWDSGVIRDE